MSLLTLFIGLAEVAIMDFVYVLLWVGRIFVYLSLLLFQLSGWIFMACPHWSMVMSCHLIGSCMAAIMDHGWQVYKYPVLLWSGFS